MAEAAKKRKVRGGNRAFVTKICNQVKEIIASYDGGQRNKLESLEKVLIEKLADLKLLDNDIVDFIDEEEALVAEITESGEFAANVQEHLMQIKDVLARTQQDEQAATSSNAATPEAASAASNTGISGHNSGVNSVNASSGLPLNTKLPKLELQTFSGNPIEWFSFWDSFNAAINSNKGLSDIDKFNYLKSLLSETAADTISGLSLTSSNYAKALELLEGRFGNNQVIISTHMELLMNIESVKSASDVRKLRFFHDKIESHIRSLESVGITPESYGSFVTPVIMNKLPEEVRIIVSRKLSGDSWKLPEIMEALRQELLLRERCAFMTVEKTTTQVQQPAAKPAPPKQAPKASTAALHTESQPNIQQSSPNTGPWCTFCKGTHHSAKCSTVTDVKERKKIIRQKGKCFLCLRSGHLLRNCTSTIKCYKCHGVHHTSICGGQARQGNPPVESTQPSATMHISNSKNCILLQTARANVSSPSDPSYATAARLIFDSCSQRSYITHQLKETLNLPVIGNETLSIKTFGEMAPKLQSCEVVQFGVTTLNGTVIYVTAYVVPVICNPLSNQHIELARNSYPHLTGLQLADSDAGSYQELDVQILIGADFYWNFVDGNTIRCNYGGPIAISTNLGWVLSGPINAVSDSQTTVNFSNTHVLQIDTCIQGETVTLDDKLSKFWEYESLGIMKQEKSLYDEFVEQVEFVGGRYEVKLPFKECHEVLPDNFALSRSRLNSLMGRLKSQPEVLKQYDQVIQEQLDQGVVEPVSTTQASTQTVGKTHYLPHHEVIRTDKETTKLRIVYDASSRAQPHLPSLNDCLYAGPPMTPLILDILFRFRVYKIALMGDVEKAFLNISVHPAFRDYLRFLWVKDIDSERPEICVYRFARVVFGVASSPFLLNATIHHHITNLKELDGQLASKILKSLYVDDLLSGADEIQSAVELYQTLKDSFALGGFNMRKWVTNSSQLKQEIEKTETTVTCTTSTLVESGIQEEDQSYSSSTLTSRETHSQSTPGTKALGVGWDNEKDVLQFEFGNLRDLLGNSILTKRTVLGTVAKLYDPLGFLSPVTLLLKILFQQLCKARIGWDTPLSTDISQQVRDIIEDLVYMKALTMDRHYFNGLAMAQLKQIQMHGFADASERAYGAVVYLRVETEAGDVFTKLVSSRTRVAPISGDTVPRLELMGALILARLMNSISSALKGTLNINEMFCWLDSQIALWWIWGVTREFKQFVQNRVTEIRGLVQPDMWNYCPTEHNPADIASRGMKASGLIENELWWSGPQFLQGGSEGWPKLEKSTVESSKDFPLVSERQQKPIKTTLAENNTTLAVSSEVKEDTGIGALIQSSSYSNIHKLLRVTSLVLRFVSNLKRGLNKADKLSGDVTKEEIDQARILWYKYVQLEITKDKSFDQVKTSLSLFKDEHDVLRCKGRIGNAPIPYQARFPILLPRLSHFTRLVIIDCHERVMHNGVRDTLSELRTGFWVVRGRQTVKSIISKCVLCKRIEGKNYGAPPSPPLPEFRLSDDFAFTRVGVDFAGPVYLRDIYVKSEELNKAYIALFTCASTRGVHLELVPDQTTPSFIRALVRFKGRRGSPVLIISDNGKTFKDSRLKAYCTRENIEWRYNVERAPWWGGFFERLVRSLKRCLKKCFRTVRMTYEEFNTALVEVEGVLNSRPLTYTYDELSEPLTPSHLIMGRRILSRHHVAAKESVSRECLTSRAKFLDRVLGHFWNRWRSEYLTELREYHHHQRKGNPQREIKLGDIVCVHEDKTPRQTWRLGKVERLLPGRDGLVRSAELRVSSKGGMRSLLRRPVQRLYPLEVRFDSVPEKGPQIQMIRDEDVGLIKEAV